MTSTASKKSVNCSRSVDLSRTKRSRSAIGREDVTPLVFALRGLEKVPPGRHVRTTTQQRTPLALGHSTPDSELNSVVEGVGQALGSDIAPHADRLGSVLGCTLNEESIGVGCAACRLRGPVGVQRHLGSSYDSIWACPAVAQKVRPPHPRC